MAKYKSGQKYGLITILEIYPYRKGDGGTRRGLVVCDCSPNKPYEMNIYNLGTGHTKSCGCLQETNAGRYQKTHGKTGTRIYNIYLGMVSRCTKEYNPTYKYYGARGVKVCDRWLESFENFYKDMGDPPTETHSLDRIDVYGNYEPSNCRWATPLVQGNNKRNHRKMTLNGETKNLSEWGRELGIEPSVILGRLKRGWTEEEALKTPTLDENKYYKYNGEVKTHQQLAKEYGLNEGTLRDRLKKGWDLDKALNTPTDSHFTKLTFNGETKTVQEWSDITGIPWKLIHGRLSEGWTVDQALSTEVKQPKKITSSDGRSYTVSEWAGKLGRGYKFIWKRLKNGDTIDDLIREFT